MEIIRKAIGACDVNEEIFVAKKWWKRKSLFAWSKIKGKEENLFR